ncbi:MAG TPA: RsmE family RNA methyltransferase [Anaerohalosphaeraceae bacterium]|nr:RsmE family RNA methyltransferase [Anaerohalosphaeraceae bacterium]HRT49352.1 RsmE family RNA methyltransferase [Anaerohalosphaeraceae bacterium]HRT85919.1 RsmE family RNA methyltransferase [Anaerohalosphaeraceae bacterium]
MARFFCDHVRPGPVTLNETESHHLIHVLRLRVGDTVEVMDGRGAVGRGIITASGRKVAVIDVGKVQTMQARQTGRLILAASIPKGPRLDTLITQCTELAADHIALTIFERTVKQPHGPTFADRCRKLAIAAAKQCGRPFLPVFSGPESLAATLQTLNAEYPGVHILFGRCGRTAPPVTGFEFRNDVIAFVGPEGGMTADEERLLEQHGATAVSLAENTLRVETAALAFCAICAAHR